MVRCNALSLKSNTKYSRSYDSQAGEPAGKAASQFLACLLIHSMRCNQGWFADSSLQLIDTRLKNAVAAWSLIIFSHAPLPLK